MSLIIHIGLNDCSTSQHTNFSYHKMSPSCMFVKLQCSHSPFYTQDNPLMPYVAVPCRNRLVEGYFDCIAVFEAPYRWTSIEICIQFPHGTATCNICLTGHYSNHTTMQVRKRKERSEEWKEVSLLGSWNLFTVSTECFSFLKGKVWRLSETLAKNFLISNLVTEGFISNWCKNTTA